MGGLAPARLRENGEGERESEGEENRGQNGVPSVATRLAGISQSNIHLGCRLPGPCTPSKSDLLPRFLSAVMSLFFLSKVSSVTDLQTGAKYY